MPIPDVEIDGEFTIFHYKSDGSVETIKPVIRGNLMSFETSSFSPFSVAGSTVITGVGVSSGVGSSGSGTSTGGSTSGEAAQAAVQAVLQAVLQAVREAVDRETTVTAVP